MRVNTVLGPVEPDDLGVTLTHEHIFLDLRFDGTEVDGVLDDVDLAIAELRRFKDAGGGAVVDVTNKYLGRNARGQLRVARETGLHVSRLARRRYEDTPPSGHAPRGGAAHALGGQVTSRGRYATATAPTAAEGGTLVRGYAAVIARAARQRQRPFNRRGQNVSVSAAEGGTTL